MKVSFSIEAPERNRTHSEEHTIEVYGGHIEQLKEDMQRAIELFELRNSDYKRRYDERWGKSVDQPSSDSGGEG